MRFFERFARGELRSIFLMFQSFIPFPTAMMGEYPTNPLAVSLFGVVMTLNTLLFIALHGHILRRLIKPDLAGTQDPHIIRKSFVGVASYLIGAAGAWVSAHVAFAIYLLTPLFFIVPPEPPRGVQVGTEVRVPRAKPR